MQEFCGFALLETVTCTVFSLFVAKYGYKILHSVLFFKKNIIKKKKKNKHMWRHGEAFILKATTWRFALRLV